VPRGEITLDGTNPDAAIASLGAMSTANCTGLDGAVQDGLRQVEA
jgi:hypothetical protein